MNLSPVRWSEKVEVGSPAQFRICGAGGPVLPHFCAIRKPQTEIWKKSSPSESRPSFGFLRSGVVMRYIPFLDANILSLDGEFLLIANHVSGSTHCSWTLALSHGMEPRGCDRNNASKCADESHMSQDFTFYLNPWLNAWQGFFCLTRFCWSLYYETFLTNR